VPIPLLSKLLPKISETDASLKAKYIKNALYSKAQNVFRRIGPHIKGRKILDVGVGVGGISSYLRQNDFDVTGIDVKNLSIIIESSPKIYNGEKMPFENNEFDTAIIVHVLHHCRDNIKVLAEAKRVAKRVIVVEDTYRNKLEKTIVSFNDNFANFEFYQHKYLTAEEWKGAIAKEGWSLVHMESYTEFTYGYLYSRYVMFVIE
jgi:ubiquinone/menaquinone biosynthesis C-methylase UbiE